MDFVPDERVKHGDVISGDGWSFECVYTPGHTSNHMCYQLREPKVLFPGDHVMGWATTLVSPPEGDMAAFMASLDRMRARAGAPDRIYYPGHGAPVRDPAAMIEHQKTHRRAREAQILAALRRIGPADPKTLTAEIYADVDPALHGAAARNVFAALLGMLEDGRAAQDGALSPDATFRAL